MKRQPTDARACGRLAPSALEAALAPRLAVAVCQHDWAAPRCRIERGLKFIGDRNLNIHAGFSLAYFDVLAIVGTPGKAQQVALPLTGVGSEQHRQPKIRRRGP